MLQEDNSHTLPLPSDATAIVTVRAMIYGRVQGVGYRAWTTSQARKRQLCGWVRNRSGGEVEAIFHGPREVVEEMLTACQDGPLAARVREVRVETSNEPVDTSFSQKPTA